MCILCTDKFFILTTLDETGLIIIVNIDINFRLQTQFDVAVKHIGD